MSVSKRLRRIAKRQEKSERKRASRAYKRKLLREFNEREAIFNYTRVLEKSCKVKASSFITWVNVLTLNKEQRKGADWWKKLNKSTEKILPLRFSI